MGQSYYIFKKNIFQNSWKCSYEKSIAAVAAICGKISMKGFRKNN